MAKKVSTSTSPVFLENVSVKRYENELLQNVTFRLEAGDFAYLTGPVGAGKSSLLELLYGELPLLEGGEASVLGYDLRKLNIRKRQAMRRRMGIVFQSQDQLLYDRNVTKNLDFVLRATSKVDKKERVVRIEEALAQVGMSGKGYKMPYELSGGEAERICIARALVVRPDLILMDEPTAGLDPETSLAIGQLMKQIASEGTTVLMATHNYELMKQLPATTYTIDPKSRTLVHIPLSTVE
ncbi:cell division ATP-binding protein FtsE [Porphyromonas circumdentaria]|uniref:Cell division transport system ATP-binding protein n=1 Tax=Porphyromonas circumdentaria TaxID=29524 RepID=A0A1T4P5R9_9PORP|nr:ATP-binding cassette domain-containing protein [Porphyromonas circumdentaria]MBB6276304.1 cell division transport system ATP-binding protein [Porphyromonas circumdentaria]MDO4722575.1 ATP-binding cassette domain-containing protein [Porphyromonas circumdentaria]SJZ86844.1 cell division transport system ATP-binding protein [Porphyromonas circumdentaria]